MSMAFDPLSIIGLSEKEAISLLKTNGIQRVRVVQRDKECIFITDDCIFDRFNLYVEKDKVYRFTKG